MSSKIFYSDSRLGNLFGVRGLLYGRGGHKGVDFKHPTGVPIPSWTAGVVVFAGYSGTLGWLVIIRRPDGLFAGFCHMRARPAVDFGDVIEVDDVLGFVGSTGLFSTGPHLHATLEPSIAIGTANAIDPLPHIRAATSVSPSRRKAGRTVTLFHTKKDGKNLFALAGDSPGTAANWLETTDQALANALAGQTGSSAYLSPTSFASWKARYLEPVKTAPKGS